MTCFRAHLLQMTFNLVTSIFHPRTPLDRRNWLLSPASAEWVPTVPSVWNALWCWLLALWEWGLNLIVDGKTLCIQVGGHTFLFFRRGVPLHPFLVTPPPPTHPSGSHKCQPFQNWPPSHPPLRVDSHLTLFLLLRGLLISVLHCYQHVVLCPLTAGSLFVHTHSRIGNLTPERLTPAGQVRDWSHSK